MLFQNLSLAERTKNEFRMDLAQRSIPASVGFILIAVAAVFGPMDFKENRSWMITAALVIFVANGLRIYAARKIQHLKQPVRLRHHNIRVGG
ncbi:MAG: hypothetical protein B7Y39_18815 [Bdellovibrio sp. 28-41-41]|nr:MAG: hypothetical protein B7Y39_18815 [Bdellovibrio sp. 28-41-41]